jgi:hypothetical protein
MNSTAGGLLTLLAILPVAQTSIQVPSRDVTVTPTTGTASITGVVVDDQPAPVAVRRAIVTLTGPGLVPSRSVVTDDDGRFLVERLPAGRFTLTVSRASFVTSLYGAKRPGRPGTAISVGAGERVTGIVARLWRGAVIAGVVRDDDGQPAPGVPVKVIAANAPMERTVFTLDNNGVRTNDAGEFRIFGLEPGPYLVSVVPPLLRGAAPTGMSEAEMDAALAALRRRAPAPARATPVPTAAPPPSAPIAIATSKPFSYAPIYYPGTANIGHATPIALVAGQSVEGIDLTLQRVPTAIVGGVVIRPDGQAAPIASVQMMQTPPDGYVLDPPPLFTTMAAADGTFRYPAVTPGDYTIVARVAIPGAAPTGRGGGPAMWGRATLSVTGADVDRLEVRVEPGPALSGRIEFTGGALKPPADLTQLQVTLIAPASVVRRTGTAVAGALTVPPVNVNADGTFMIEGIPPGAYQFQVTGTGVSGAEWWPRSLVAGDRDLLDRLIEVGVGSPTMGAVLAMSDRHTELSGRLQTPTGQPASDVFVIAFSADRRMWGPGARRVRAVRPGVDGLFSIADLPPGDYLLGAVTDVDADEWQRPAFLEQLAPASIKITIGEGEKRVQDLRLGGG